MPHKNVPPSRWVTRFAPLIRSGTRVLDVACGAGRHARFCLERGAAVTGLDKDLSDLGASFDGPGRWIEADLENGSPWPLPGETFDIIIVTNYLHRPLFPVLRAALTEGGVLIYETFMEGNQAFGRPNKPEFLLKSNELLDTFGADMTVIAFEQGHVVTSDPSAGAALKKMVQRIAVRNSRPPVTLPEL